MISADLFWSLPFAALLICIATGPLFYKHWWEKFYPAVSVGLGALVAAYYIFSKQHPDALVHAGQEYISFICLIGSLYIVAAELDR